MLVNDEYFLEVNRKGIPKMIYQSNEYNEWWKEQHNRCIYGYTVGGRWMSGKLYHYVNFWHIERNTDVNTTRKSIGLPSLGELEWDIFTAFDEAKNERNPYRGEVDYYRSSITPDSVAKGIWVGGGNWRSELLGSKGMLIAGARDSGKSFMVASIVGHEYTFYPSNETLVTACETAYSNKLMAKIQLGLDNYKGSEVIGSGKNAVIAPAYFYHHRIKRDFKKEVRSGYYLNNSDIPQGYNSVIYNRCYGDKSMAMNGFRPSVQPVEETGIWNGVPLVECIEDTKSCLESGGIQTGVPIYLGTGGDMDTGISGIRKLMYQPDAYNLLSFDNKYEKKGGKISYFIQGHLSVRHCKKPDGSHDAEAAQKVLDDAMDELIKAGNKLGQLKRKMYKPKSPAEMFLRSRGSTFPLLEVGEQLGELEFDDRYATIERRGFLIRDAVSKEVRWEEDQNLQPVPYPLTDTDHKDGCICIYEHPCKNDTSEVLYVAGLDPYDHDVSNTSSLGSIVIYKRKVQGQSTFNFVVAEYTARPAHPEVFYENALRLLEYYDALCMHENEKVAFKNYAVSRGKSKYLMTQPYAYLAKLIPNSVVERIFGIHMVLKIRKDLEEKYAIYLIRIGLSGLCNVYKIYSKGILGETLDYNTDQSFDRIDAFMLALLGDSELGGGDLTEEEEYEKRTNVSIDSNNIDQYEWLSRIC